MKGLIILFTALLVSGGVKSQSETDSLFFFDSEFNYVSNDSGAWVSRKEQLYQDEFKVYTSRMHPSKYHIKKINDHYTKITDSSFSIKRKISNRDGSFDRDYLIDVKILNHSEEGYELLMYSEILNIHQQVTSKTIVPICPINKTIFFHGNCKQSKVDYHDKNIPDSVWTSKGEIIPVFFYQDEVDSLPVLTAYSTSIFSSALRRIIGDSLTFPQVVLDADINGHVYYTFLISKEGVVELAEVMLGLHPMLDAQVLEIVRKLEVERPAMKNNEYVNVFCMQRLEAHVH